MQADDADPALRRFNVQLVPSGHVVQVASGQNVLDAAIAAGIRLPYSCRNGMCRTCRATIVSGQFTRVGIDPRYLSAAEAERGVTLLCKTEPLSDCIVEVGEFPDALQIPRRFPVRVSSVTYVAPDVAILVLRAPMNRAIFFRPGQYLDVVIEDGQRRSYSIASVPRADGLQEVEIHIRHMPGGLFTDLVFGSLRKGAMLNVEAPLGTFILREESTGPLLFIVSGTGFAPIRSMVEDALERGLFKGRDIHVYWGGRRLTDLYQLDRAVQWSARNSRLKFVPVLSAAVPEDNWTGRTGLVHEAALQDIARMDGWQVYACGTPAMIEAARRDFTALRGVAADHFFADAFLTQADRDPPPSGIPTELRKSGVNGVIPAASIVPR